jgi:hypothetical protein
VGRTVLLALLSLAVSCSREHAPAAPEPAPRALPAPAPQLPALQRARLDYLFAAARLVAASWPRMLPDQTCVLLLEPALQWVINCDAAPQGFAQNGETFQARPIFWHAGDAFEAAGRRRSTRELLALTPAAAQLGGERSGLPAQHAWLLLGSLEALAAYHPAFPRATTEAWISVAMHELVHMHQLRDPAFATERAQIESGEANPDALTQLYEHDPAYRQRVEREYAQLVAAAQRAQDERAVLRALRDWTRAYAERRKFLAAQSGELQAREATFSYLEGVARFAESDFLQNAAQHPALDALARDPRFGHYALFLNQGYAGSPNRQLDPQYYYALGYHLALLLARIDPGWASHLSEQPGWLIGLVERRSREARF